MQRKEGNRMILKRKIFVDPDYKGLNEAEEQWLREKDAVKKQIFGIKD